MRLRFWLWALDAVHALRLPRSVYLWCVGKASAATDWGDTDGWTKGDGPW